MPAASATATIASATRISTSVNPDARSGLMARRVRDDDAVERIGVDAHARPSASSTNVARLVAPARRAAGGSRRPGRWRPRVRRGLEPARRRAVSARRARRRRRSASQRVALAIAPPEPPSARRPRDTPSVSCRHCARCAAYSIAPAKRRASRSERRVVAAAPREPCRARRDRDDRERPPGSRPA